MIQSLAGTMEPVRAWRRQTTTDGWSLRIDCSFSADDVDNTMTQISTRQDDQGRVEKSQRLRSFEACIQFRFTDNKSTLVFHRGDPETTIETRNTAIVVPGTLIDGMWFRGDSATREVLRDAALECGISPRLRELLQPTLDTIGDSFAKAVSEMTLKDYGTAKSAGVFSRKKNQFHMNFGKFQAALQRRFVDIIRPGITQLTYCLGRHGQSLKSDWQKVLEEIAVPPVMTRLDMDSDKWNRRLRSIQDAGLIDEHHRIRWATIDSMTSCGQRLERFVNRGIESGRIGIEKLIHRYGILTPESEPDSWQIASMLRLIYYFRESVRQKEVDKVKERKNIGDDEQVARYFQG